MELWLFIFSVCALCLTVSSQTLVASINMGGIKARLEFTSTSPTNVTAILNDDRTGFPDGKNVQVYFYSFWVDYDVKDKCTVAQLGPPINSLYGAFNTPNFKSFILQNTAVADLEGRSVVLVNGSDRYCATILKEGTYDTALASFHGVVSGNVYFRQSNGSNQQTIMMNNFKSNTQFFNPTWKVIEDENGCADLNTLSDKHTFNVNNASPAIGDFISRVGTPLIGSPIVDNKQFHATTEVTLSGTTSIVNKYLVVYDEAHPCTVIACSKIEMLKERKASVRFSNDGVVGSVSFTQSSPFDETHTNVNLQGLGALAKGYHVHLYPVPVQEVKGQSLCLNDVVAGHFNPFNILIWPSPAVGTVDQYEVGDLSSKYGTLAGLSNFTQNYTDMNLPLFGANSIIGRSLVIHKNDAGGSRWVCANILPDDTVIAGVAVFTYPIIGHVYFTRSKDTLMSDTWVFARLAIQNTYPNKTDTTGHMWSINENKVALTSDVNPEVSCLSAGDAYAPYNCTTTSCKLGNMGTRHGTLGIGSTVPSKAFFTDTMLTLSGDQSIIGKSVVIKMQDNSKVIMACAAIERLPRSELKATMMGNAGITGSVYFSQEPGYGARPTTVSLMLSEVDNSNSKIQIHSLPPMTADDMTCSDLGEIYNPLNYTGNLGTSDDQFAVGADLFRFGSFETGTNLNLPLSGVTSIRHRSVVVLNKQTNDIQACGIIQEPFSISFSGYQVSARVLMGTPLQGWIDLFQVLYDDGSMSDTSIVVNLKNENEVQTPDHNWHVHVRPVYGDSNAATGRCQSTGGHFDPSHAKVGNASQQYDEECGKINPLRCELGDQAKKVGTYSLGEGRKVFTDVDLPLYGLFKVQGRSIVVHVKDKGAARYGCADIVPFSTSAVAVVFTTPRVLDLQAAAKSYAVAIKVEEYEIVLEYVSTTNDRTNVKVHFLGLKRAFVRGKFLAYFGKADNRNSFGTYAPLSDPSHASISTIAPLLLLVTLAIHYVL